MNIMDSYQALKLDSPSDSEIATRFLFGLDDDRYESLKIYLGNEAANKRDLYPTTLDEAATQATRWIVHKANIKEDSPLMSAFVTVKSPTRKDNAFPNVASNHDQSGTCTFCSRTGHSMDACHKFIAAQKEATELAHNQRIKRKARNTKPMLIAAASKHYTGPEECDITTSEPAAFMKGFYAYTINQTCNEVNNRDLILDTGASGSIVKDITLLTNIRTLKTPICFGGISGTLTVTQIGNLQDLCEAFYHPRSPANIISFSQLHQAGHIINLAPNNTFTVTTPTQTYVFDHRDNGLYIHHNPVSTRILLSTVANNESKYTKREVTRAREARAMQQRLANPPDNKLSLALANGNIVTGAVLPADIARAHQIYGPNPNALQGRTTTRRPSPFPEPTIPRLADPQAMYADVFTACGMQFLLTITKPIDHLLATLIDNRDTASLRKALRIHIGFYGHRNITITNLYTDNEKGLSNLTSDLSAAHILPITCGPGMHVHTIERSIRYIKEGVRGVLHGLPYTCPRIIFKTLIPYIALRLNLFPSSTRTDQLSAFQLIYNRSATADKDCHLDFGALYHVTSRTGNNTMAPRTITAIGVGQIPNGTGTCTFFSLSTHTFISANHFVHLPMTQEVINHLNAVAAKDKFKISITAPFYLNGTALSDSPLPPNEPPVPADAPPEDTSPHTTHAPSLTEDNTERTHEVRTPHKSDTHSIYEEPHTPMRTPYANERTSVQTLYGQDPLPAHNEELNSHDTLPSESTIIINNTDRPEHTETASTVRTRAVRTSAPPTAYQHPSRERRPPTKLNLMSVYHMTAKQALRDIPHTARPAIESELRTLVEKGVFRPIHTRLLTPTQRSSIIRSQLNVVQKFLPSTEGNGRAKDKVKARLVGGGDCQDRNHYSRADTSSPTISTSSIFIIAQIAAAEQHTLATIDIGSAYLNAVMPKDNINHLVFMRIAKEPTAILIEIEPTFNAFKNADGTLVVELDKALYGCLQSALLWYHELANFLQSIGFQPNAYDLCVFNRDSREGRTTIGVYVDDLIITSPLPSLVRSTIAAIEKKYIQLKIHEGTTHNYLGMVLDFSHSGHVHVNQTGMIQEITKSTSIATIEEIVGTVEQSPTTPSHENLFHATEDSPLLPPLVARELHSLTARILFIANRGRPDLITFISYMTKKVLAPTHEDGRKLLRAIYYMRNIHGLRVGQTRAVARSWCAATRTGR